MKPLTITLAVLMMFVGGEVYAGKIAKSFPDRVEHAKMLLKLRPGLPLKQFRTLISAHWRSGQEMFSYKQNKNPRGETNLGYYYFSLEARGTIDPQTVFIFWDGKIASVRQSSTSSDFEESQEFLKDADRLFPIISKIYGKPTIAKRNERERRYEWKANTFTIFVSANLPDIADPRSLGDLSVRMKNKIASAAAHKFSRRYPEKKQSSGPIGLVNCSRQALSGARRWLIINLYIDTRKMDNRTAKALAEFKSSGLIKSGYKCNASISNSSSFEDVMERVRQKLPSLNTYLRFFDGDGLLNAINFPNSKVPIEDKLCDVYLKSLSKTGLGAECITGTKIWHRAPDN